MTCYKLSVVGGGRHEYNDDSLVPPTPALAAIRILIVLEGLNDLDNSSADESKYAQASQPNGVRPVPNT